MPRKIVPYSPILPYHLSARCNRRESFPIALSDVWKVFEDYLYLMVHGFGLELLSFTLMPNHFHLIAKDPHLKMGEATNYLMRETSKVIGRLSNTSNHLWGSRIHRSMIDKNIYLNHAYKYVYRNPTHALICRRVEEYSYSTLPGLLGIKRCHIPLAEDHILFRDVEDTIDWLNTPPSADSYLAVKSALRRRLFKLPRDKSNNKVSQLEDSPF